MHWRWGLNDDVAQSQEHNVKLTLVAEQILKDLVELSRIKGPIRQLAFGGLLSTADQRIKHSAVRQLNGERRLASR
jgi:hypothetical protein